MRYKGRTSLPLVALGAALVMACSGSGPPVSGNVREQANESAPVATGFAPGQEAVDVASSLCAARARQVFGIVRDDPPGATFAGSGDTPQSLEGQVTLHFDFPRRPSVRCELAAGRVQSIVELDARGNPVAAPR